MLFVFRNSVEGRNPQGLKEGGWIERELCCIVAFQGGFSGGNSTFLCKCGFEPLAVRDVPGSLAAGASRQGGWAPER